MIDKYEKNVIILSVIEVNFMIAKYWKKVCFIILIIACLFNVVSKLVQKTSLLNEIQSSVQFISDHKIKSENN